MYFFQHLHHKKVEKPNKHDCVTAKIRLANASGQTKQHTTKNPFIPAKLLFQSYVYNLSSIFVATFYYNSGF